MIHYSKLLFLLAFALLTHVAFGQDGGEKIKEKPFSPDVQWEKTYGKGSSSKIYKMIRTHDMGFLYVGQTYTDGVQKLDGWVFKTDANGEKLWERKIGHKGTDFFNDVAIIGNEGYAIVGSTWAQGKGRSDVWVVKIDLTGHVRWERTFGTKTTERGSAIVVNKRNNIVVAGSKHHSNYVNKNGKPKMTLDHFVWLLEIDMTGTKIWDERLHTDKMAVVTDFHHTWDDGYLISTITRMEADNKENALIIKVDEEGLLLWRTWLGGENTSDMIHALQPTYDGSFLAAGITVNPNDIGDGDGWLLNLTSQGHVVWEKVLGSFGSDEFYDMVQSKDGNFVVTGTYGESSPEEGSMWLVKINKAGKLIWERTCGTGVLEKAYALSKTIEGDYILAGYPSDKERAEATDEPTVGTIARSNQEPNVRIIKLLEPALPESTGFRDLRKNRMDSKDNSSDNTELLESPEEGTKSNSSEKKVKPVGSLLDIVKDK